MNTIGERLKELLNKNNIKSAELSKEIDIPKATISNYINNKYKPTADALVKICEFFNITIDWLLIGKENNIQNIELDKEEQYLLDIYKKLNEKNKGKVETYAEERLDQQTKEELATADLGKLSESTSKKNKVS